MKQRDGDDANYVVGEEYSASVTVTGPGAPSDGRLKIAVPKGMLTDLCSVPRLARWLVSRVGPHLEASILHGERQQIDFCRLRANLSGRRNGPG